MIENMDDVKRMIQESLTPFENLDDAFENMNDVVDAIKDQDIKLAVSVAWGRVISTITQNKE